MGSISSNLWLLVNHQVNVPRLDDPSAGTFERCSSDTFQIYGPCTYDVCYAYLLRRGYDGWKVGSVQIYGTYTRTVSFTYNDFLPNNVWWGFNYCSGAFAASRIMQISTISLLCQFSTWTQDKIWWLVDVFVCVLCGCI